jgi:hypothetical protein
MAVDIGKVAAAAIDAAFNEAPPQAEPRRKHSALRALVVGMGVAAAARVVAKRGPDLWHTVTSQYEGLRDKVEAELLDDDLEEAPEAEFDDEALDEVVPGEEEDEDVEEDDDFDEDEDEDVEEDDDVEDEEPVPASRSRARAARGRR